MSHRRMVCFVLVATLLASFSAVGVFAEGYPKVSVNLEGGLHLEARDLVGSFTNGDASLGIDFLVWDGFDLYVGPRVGVSAETTATAYMAADLATYTPVTFGGQVYFLMPTALSKELVITAGAAYDGWLYTEAVHWDPSDYQPLYGYGEVFLGLRYYLARRWHVETRVAAGTMPFWSDPPVFLGVRLGVGLDF
jgi:hypothetical protein